MSQNLITMNLGNDDFAAVDGALTELETRLNGMVAMSKAQRRAATKMGQKSEAFCRQTLNALALYPKLVPPGIGFEDAKADLTALDQLRPRFERLRNLAQRADDSEFALGSDIMVTALKGYGVLKLIDKSQGLEELRRGLGQRFSRVTRQAPEEPTTA